MTRTTRSNIACTILHQTQGHTYPTSHEDSPSRRRIDLPVPWTAAAAHGCVAPPSSLPRTARAPSLCDTPRRPHPPGWPSETSADGIDTPEIAYRLESPRRVSTPVAVPLSLRGPRASGGSSSPRPPCVNTISGHGFAETIKSAAILP